MGREAGDEKPDRITRIGSGRDSPESPRNGSNPAGAKLFGLYLQAVDVTPPGAGHPIPSPPANRGESWVIG